MTARGVSLLLDMFRGHDRKATIVVLSSTILIAAWWCLANGLPAQTPTGISSVLE